MMLKSLQRGALLMVAVVLVLIIVAMVTAMSFLSVSNTTASGSHLSSAQAFFIANSGLERALFQFSKLDTDCAALTNTNLAVGAGSFSTTGIVYPTAATTSTLSGAITSTATIIPVTSIASFAPHGRILIENEEIDYAEASTDAADCGTAPCFIAEKRGENGTTAAAHASAVAVYQPTQCLIQSTGTAGSAKRVLEAVARELSVQSGTVTFGASTTITVTYPTFKPVNPNRAFVVCQSRNASSHPDQRVTCELTNATTLTITVGDLPSAQTISWYVVEFVSGVSVQRGLAAYGASLSLPVAISAVDLAKTFVLITERDTTSTSDSRDEQWATRGQLTSTTNLQLDRTESGLTVSVAWQAIQINSATVQKGLVTIPINQTSVTAPLSPAVDLTKTFLVFSRQAGTAIAGTECLYMIRGEITNGTTLTFYRAKQTGAASTTVDIAWFAVSMTDGTTVQGDPSKTFTAAIGTTTKDNALSAIVLNRSVPIYSDSADPASPTCTGDLDDLSWSAVFTSTTNLRIQRNASNSSSTAAWFVTQFAPQISLVDEREIFL